MNKEQRMKNDEVGKLTGLQIYKEVKDQRHSKKYEVWMY